MMRTDRNNSGTLWLQAILDFLLQAWRLSRGTVHGKIALALVFGGVNAITGNWLQALINAAWQEVFSSPINIPEVSPLFGVFLVLLGVGVVWIFDIRLRAERERQHLVPECPVVAIIRHESMEALTQPLQASSLPSDMANAEIHNFSINQSPFYGDGILTASNAEAAIRVQSNLVPSIRGFLTDRPSAKIIYYGKAHIPFVFLAGHSLSTGWPVRLYELGRHKGDWWAIDETIQGGDIGLQLEQANGYHVSREVVIRISISYWVQRTEVEEALRRPYRDIHISVRRPQVDAVRTRHQIEVAAKMFRELLDGLKAEDPGPEAIHVFYSGPMSLAFCLGRQISPTIHPPTLVYNYTAKTFPKYAWALRVNGSGRGEPLIVSTAPVTV